MGAGEGDWEDPELELLDTCSCLDRALGLLLWWAGDSSSS